MSERIKERYDEEEPEEFLPAASEIEAQIERAIEAQTMSPEDQEQMLQDMYEYQEGLRDILAERQADFAAELDEENAKVLQEEIRYLEKMIAEFEEFLEDVTPEE